MNLYGGGFGTWAWLSHSLGMSAGVDKYCGQMEKIHANEWSSLLLLLNSNPSKRRINGYSGNPNWRGKDQYGWPPLLSAAFYTDTIFFFFTKQPISMRSTVVNHLPWASQWCNQIKMKAAGTIGHHLAQHAFYSRGFKLWEWTLQNSKETEMQQSKLSNISVKWNFTKFDESG